VSTFKRLKGSSGSVQNGESDKAVDGQLRKKCILVHSGPDGSEITFESGDGEIKFDADRIKNIVKNQNQVMDALRKEYGDAMPIGAYDPVLDQHENDSNDRIRGRMTDNLEYAVMDVPKVGKNVSCAVTWITFIGEDNIQKVLDGRIYHLSIGIDENSDTLGEVSTVIEPAAPGAMLLSQSKDVKKSRKEERMPTPNVKRLASHKKRLTALKQIGDQLSTLQGKGKEAIVQLKQTEKAGKVTHRLTALMRSGKLTPAEYKKMDVKKLSKLSDDSLDTVIGTFELREPQVDPTQRGSKDAVEFSDIGRGMKKTDIKRLKAETRGALKKLGAKIKEDPEADAHLSGPKEEEIQPGKDPHEVPGQEGDEKQLAHLFAKHMAHLKSCLEEGDVEGAKGAHAEMASHLEEHGVKHLEGAGTGDVKSEDYQKSMNELQAQVDEQNTQMARLAGMVQELVKGEEEEGQELEAGEEEPVNGPAGKPKVIEDKH